MPYRNSATGQERGSAIASVFPLERLPVTFSLAIIVFPLITITLFQKGFFMSSHKKSFNDLENRFKIPSDHLPGLHYKVDSSDGESLRFERKFLSFFEAFENH
jgi:hypothetical protein